MFYDKDRKFIVVSSFYDKAPINIDGSIWKTSENFYQAMKFGHRLDFIEVIRNCDTPGKVYALANQKKCQYTGKWFINKSTYGEYTVNQAIDDSLKANIQIRPDWDNIKNDVMIYILRQKFTQNLTLKNLLLSTGNSILVEESPRDSYWGIGKNRDGKNMLGKLLMDLREELKNI